MQLKQATDSGTLNPEPPLCLEDRTLHAPQAFWSRGRGKDRWCSHPLLNSDQTPQGMNVLARLPIRVCPVPAPAPGRNICQAARAPHLPASLPGPQESLDSEIGSWNTFAPIIILPSLTPPPPALFFFYTKLSLNSPDFSHLLYILYGNGEIITASPAG